MKKINILDVAKYAGVSKTTVSNYLNNKFEYMSFETKGRIKQAIADLKYVPSVGAQMLKKERCGVICVTISYYMADTTFFYRCLQGINDAAKKLGYRILIYSSSKDGRMEDDATYLKGLGRGMVDGFLLFEITMHDLYVQALEESKLPYVCFGKLNNTKYNKYVCLDHENGAEKSIDYLISRGHQRIAILVGKESLIVSHRVVDAYKRVLQENRIPVDDDLIIFMNNDHRDYDNEYKLIRKMFTLSEPPTAAYVCPDYVSVFQGVLKDVGKSAPNDFSIILSDFFDDRYYVEYKKFSHLKMPVYQLGITAVNSLMLLIEGHTEEFQPTVLPVELIINDSCSFI